MQKWKYWIIFVIGIVLFSLITGYVIETEINKIKFTEFKVTNLVTTSLNKQKVKVIRVIDGDTIEIEGGDKVRYIGIDTPETVDPKQSIQCFGQEADIKNKELVEGKELELEKDVNNTDRYGRLLRYVWIDNEMINEKLIRLGYAKLETVPPDVKYSERLIKAEKDARVKNIGLWSKCR